MRAADQDSMRCDIYRRPAPSQQARATKGSAGLPFVGGVRGAPEYAPRMGRFAYLRGNMRRNRVERRKLLTRGERIVGWTPAASPSLLALGGLELLVFGGAHTVGIGLLVLALLVMAVPIPPILRATSRRREARNAVSRSGQAHPARSGGRVR